MNGKKKKSFAPRDNSGNNFSATGGGVSAANTQTSTPEQKTSKVFTHNDSSNLFGSSSFQLTSHKLNSHNYLEWAQSVKLAIDGIRKIGPQTGESTKPPVGDPAMAIWRYGDLKIL